LNIYEGKTHLSRYLEKPKKGETILLCKRNEPIAEIRPLPSQPTHKCPIGLAKGQLTIPNEFFDPLPEEIIEAFHSQQS
jgi:antitoxin (DNA-binding transcriptional repressor) of toxin-antitoxin stability system